MLRLAFCLYKYSPFGGLERNFLRIAQACVAAGHQVTVFTRAWQSDVIPDGITVTLVKASGFSNVAKSKEFNRALWRQCNPTDFDLVVGFNRIPWVDLYYCADSCHFVNLQQTRRLWLRFTPRQRFFLLQEKGVFAKEALTHVMFLAHTEKQHYQSVYHTDESRFHYLPPGIDKLKIRQPEIEAFDKQAFKTQLGLSAGDQMLLMIGSDYKRKGVSRAIYALASLPDALRANTHLFVVGKGKASALQALALRLGISSNVHFMGGRDDVPHFLYASDYLLHTAVIENTGNAIVEALIAGLPVITLDHCGYAFHVERAQAGLVSAGMPFDQAALNVNLQDALSHARHAVWGPNAYQYADQTDLYSRPQVAVQIIEECAAQIQRASLAKPR